MERWFVSYRFNRTIAPSTAAYMGDLGGLTVPRLMKQRAFCRKARHVLNLLDALQKGSHVLQVVVDVPNPPSVVQATMQNLRALSSRNMSSASAMLTRSMPSHALAKLNYDDAL